MQYLNLSSPDLNAHLLNVKYIRIVSFFRLLVAKEVRNLCCHEKTPKTITDKIGTRKIFTQAKEREYAIRSNGEGTSTSLYLCSYVSQYLIILYALWFCLLFIFLFKELCSSCDLINGVYKSVGPPLRENIKYWNLVKVCSIYSPSLDQCNFFKMESVDKGYRKKSSLEAWVEWHVILKPVVS